MQTALLNADIFDGEQLHQGKALLIDNGRVAAVLAPSQLADHVDRVDLNAQLVVPGLVDVQVNGGGGVLFNTQTDVQGLQAIANAHMAAGTTSLLPTIISDSDDVMRQGIAAVAMAMKTMPAIIGIHLEGPCLNSDKRGVHAATAMRALDDEMLALMTSLKSGKTMVTLAPECVPATQIQQLSAQGVIVAAGHSQASFEQAQSAISAGLRGVTHLFNAMSPLSSRAPGLPGAALSDDRVWFGIIVDGHHVHPATVKMALRSKAHGGAILVSDAMPSVGAQDHSFTLYGETIHVHEGRCVNSDGRLAGAHLSLLQAVHNAARFADIDWFEALRMASVYPARAVGLAPDIGSLQAGSQANFLVLDNSKQLQQVWSAGERRY